MLTGLGYTKHTASFYARSMKEEEKLFVVGTFNTIRNMMMETSDVKEFFTYNHTVRQNYIDVFKKLYHGKIWSKIMKLDGCH